MPMRQPKREKITMKLILDAMGGDNAPGMIVKGAVKPSELGAA